MKIAIITDTHWGARNDSQFFTDYFVKFYNDIFFPELLERNIDTVVHMGDIVDRRKFINYKTLYQMRHNFFDRCWEQYINLHIIIGNHDTFFKNTNDVNSMDCLRMMSSGGEGDGGGFVKVYQNPTNFEGLPPTVFDKFDFAFSGHFHHKSDNGTVYYLGNPYQITWSDYKDPRGFHIFDTETRELEFIVNPYEMFHKIFYDDEKTTLEEIQEEDYDKYKGCYVKVVIVEKKNPFWFDTLIDKLYKADVADISVVENFDMDDIEGEELINEAEDTMTILSKYVQSMEIEQKSELDKLMKSLYTESLTVETI